MSLKKETNPNQKQKKHKLDDNTFSSIVAFGIVGGIILVLVLAGFIGNIIDNAGYKKIIDMGDHIDTEKDEVVLTYPALLFGSDEERKTSIETLTNSEGVMKVVENSDGSITALMTVEKYEDIKQAAFYTAQSIPFISAGEDTAVQNAEYNEECTQIELYVTPNHESLPETIENILYTAALYHACNMNPGALITINYYDANTQKLYLTEVYDIEGNLITNTEI